MQQELTARQSSALLGLLSLDGALPMYTPMGVPVAEPARFQATLRAVIAEARAQYDADPRVVPPILRTLTERLNDPSAFALWAAGCHLGDHAEQPDWSAWDIVFSHWAHSRQAALGFLTPANRDSLVKGYIGRVVPDPVRPLALAALAGRMSDWDLALFARHGHGVSFDESPYPIAESVAKVERLKRFVAELWAGLSPGERRDTTPAAQSLIDELRVWMPGRVPSLESLLGNPS